MRGFVPLAMMALLITTTLSVSVEGQIRMPFGKRSVAADDHLELTQKNGPWLIMCASFSGDSGYRKAENLALELRKKHQMRAYVYRHRFDHSEVIKNNVLQTYTVDASKDHAKPSITKDVLVPATDAQYDEFAVMVGDFPTLEDSKAQKTLAKIKSLTADSIESSLVGAAESNLSAERIRMWRHNRKNIPSAEKSSRSVMASALLLPNPLLPDDYFEKNGVDPFVLKMNKRVKHSLLDNPGVYTVRVATFGGSVKVGYDEDGVDEKKSWFSRHKDKESKLLRAIEKAHELTVAFRKKGIEAYEFHDRYESYVCIGSFDWLAREDGLGNKVQNPEIVKTILKYRGKVKNIPGPGGQAAQIVQAYTLPSLAKKKISCDVQPIPVLVPKATKRSASNRLLGSFR